MNKVLYNPECVSPHWRLSSFLEEMKLMRAAHAVPFYGVGVGSFWVKTLGDATNRRRSFVFVVGLCGLLRREIFPIYSLHNSSTCVCQRGRVFSVFRSFFHV